MAEIKNETTFNKRFSTKSWISNWQMKCGKCGIWMMLIIVWLAVIWKAVLALRMRLRRWPIEFNSRKNQAIQMFGPQCNRMDAHTRILWTVTDRRTDRRTKYKAIPYMSKLKMNSHTLSMYQFLIIYYEYTFERYFGGKATVKWCSYIFYWWKLLNRTGKLIVIWIIY